MVGMVNHPGRQPQYLLFENLEKMQLVWRVASRWWFVVRIERDCLHVDESEYLRYQVNILLLIRIYLLIFLLYLRFKHFYTKYVLTEK
jgi:hypothetical protein